MAARTQRTGTDRATGRLLRGRAHAEQSVRDILATRRGTRVMRLDYGSDLAALRGENMTKVNVLRAYAEMVEAIHDQEPAVRVAKVALAKLDGRAGIIGFDLYLVFYPYGHLGDYSVAEDIDMRVPVTALARGTA
jgi:phage baseplate assembly protein W